MIFRVQSTARPTSARRALVTCCVTLLIVFKYIYDWNAHAQLSHDLTKFIHHFKLNFTIRFILLATPLKVCFTPPTVWCLSRNGYNEFQRLQRELCTCIERSCIVVHIVLSSTTVFAITCRPNVRDITTAPPARIQGCDVKFRGRRNIHVPKHDQTDRCACSGDMIEL